ncbi:MAG: hypothetical protein HY830_13040 [Actinobacteria bacterium]|nr:hypothetical protein [Actinomycetota bacterium]
MTVRLMSDYGCDVPLWGATPEDLGLSDALVEELRDWRRFFEERCHWEDGWRGAGDAEHYASEGRRLRRWVQAEAGVPVELDL